MARELLSSKNIVVKSVFATEEWIENHARALQVPRFIVGSTELKQISNYKTPDQVVLVCEFPTFSPPLADSRFTIYLDGLSDPGNLGTIIRTAHWFGVDHIVLSVGSVDCFNSKCVQASMGSIAHVPISYMGLPALEDAVPGAQIIQAETGGRPMPDVEIRSPFILIIGSESHGISQQPSGKSAITVGIPRGSESTCESLNAAMATAAILAQLQVLRKR